MAHRKRPKPELIQSMSGLKARKTLMSDEIGRRAGGHERGAGGAQGDNGIRTNEQVR
jgi:hypothetical protein